MESEVFRILLFSRSIYPRSGGSAFVTEELSKHFARGEFAVVGGNDILFSKKLKRGDSAPEFFYLPSQISFKGRGERFFAWARIFLFPFNFLQAIVLVKRKKPNIIVATFPDAYFCLLALLCARFRHIPYVTYFHNTYLENRKGFDRWLASLIQGILFKRSIKIFVMSDGLKNYYEQAYPHVRKFHTLVHTYQNKSTPAVEIPNRAPKAKFNIAFTGNFNDSNMESTVRTVNAIKGLPQIKMNFYTPVPRALLKLRGLDVNAINYVGYLPRENYKESLSKNDIMVLTHGFTGGYSSVEYETIFPTRTIELLLTRKPIFAHVPAFSFLAKFLIEHHCAEVVTDSNEETIRKSMLSLLVDEKRQYELIHSADKVVDVFYGPNVIEDWKRVLLESIEHAS